MNKFCFNETKLIFLQVIVGRIKDNWRLAHLAGTSNLHVLDKFSITLQCERRMVNSLDPGSKFNVCVLLNVFLPVSGGEKLMIFKNKLPCLKNVNFRAWKICTKS
jgi:hypothetical protein